MIFLVPVEKNENVSSEGQISKPANWPFMEQSGEVLKNPPITWNRYPKTENGLKSIIEMEFDEFKQTEAKGLPKEDRSRELVHLASACLYLWEYLNVANTNTDAN